MSRKSTIREYVKGFRFMEASSPSSWLSKSEIPSSSEINGEGENTEEDESVSVPVNKVHGPWESKEEYLSGHYLLLREDAVTSLRNVVSELRNEPDIMEEDSQENASIYEKVHITGLTFATSGIGARITFSLRRAGKKVLWEQSKRLVSGSMVALTPANDMFKTICRVATVAARPLAGVMMNPPEIDIFFASPTEIEIDPQQEWVMAECKDGYFEAYRHTLRSLQRMSVETFPLSEHLALIDQDIQPPPYLVEQPFKDLSILYPPNPQDFVNVDLINDWPRDSPPVLDASQFEALRRILTKQLAIVQGPPGTGKTHVSVVALELLLRNMTPGDPPIILAAHTNHAVDQLLRHVSNFEPNFIRLGGMTTDHENIRPRTLFEVKASMKSAEPASVPKPPSQARRRMQSDAMRKLLQPLSEVNEPLSSELFKQYGIISHAQFTSLEKGAAEWVRIDEPGQIQGDMAMWLGKDLIKAGTRTLPEDFGIDIEEVDLEFEQLKEMEAESKLEDDSMDALKGESIGLKEPFTGRKTRGVTDEAVNAALEKENLWDINQTLRGPVYRCWQQQLKDAMRKSLRELAKSYEETVEESKIGRWEGDATVLQNARIIGMTTTGLSKYRALIQSLRPRIVLIEEAAETLEAYVTAACFPSLQHLVLVGDHQQLRGHCTVQDLEGDPWYLDWSMFERLVKNDIGFSKMVTQRRMIPEIRRALKPIYEELEDHESVLNRAPIAGMGGVNTYFFTHDWPESTDSHMSKINQEEATMIVGFFDYLMHNGMRSENITVLTFYNGQRKLILRALRNHPNLQGCIFKVVTVDSYQGEENDIVILSLVRNNDRNNIGFLSIENRVCVALSRAQRGFYVFGNTVLLSHMSSLWWDVVAVMSEDPNRVGPTLPVTCTNHGETVHITEPHQFSTITGGCERECRDELPCGHICALTCHPFPHHLVNCKKPCKKVLDCGHDCSELCHLPCKCALCMKGKVGENSRTNSPARPSDIQRSLHRLSQNDLTGEGKAFRDFAQGGHIESDARLAAATEEVARLSLHPATNKPKPSGGDQSTGQDMKLVRTSSSGGQTRGVWKGVWGNPGVLSASKAKENVSEAKPVRKGKGKK
ncbi:hypothetical protein MMC07_007043 [Pseudocyphellaria aurata]|nr:hypothetical protein [Pseudocyphellaria aurata]